MTDNPNKSEIYNTFVQTITAAENRRQQISAVYLSLVAAGITFIGTGKLTDVIYVVAPMTVIGLIWLSSIYYFRRLAQAKFAVVEKLEGNWDIRPFELEWREFLERSKNPILRVGLTYLEMVPPAGIIVFGVLYLLYRCVSAVF